MRETTEAKIEFHDRYWKNVSCEGGYLLTPSAIIVHAIIVLVVSAKDFIKRLLNPDPNLRPTAEEALQDKVGPSLSRIIEY